MPGTGPGFRCQPENGTRAPHTASRSVAHPVLPPAAGCPGGGTGATAGGPIRRAPARADEQRAHLSGSLARGPRAAPERNGTALLLDAADATARHEPRAGLPDGARIVSHARPGTARLL